MSAHATTPETVLRRNKKKIVVIMGPTGCGKTKLSIDLASRFFPSSEIINSDKIQVYRGLDITTNKLPLPERKNVRHHLLGEFDSSDSHPEFTPSDFRSSASKLISQITSRRRLPFVVGGSNSFIYALLAKKFNPEFDVFNESNSDSKSVFCKELRYDCCFIWVDVSFPVLNQYLVRRVDDMLDSGMFEELAEYFENPGEGGEGQHVAAGEEASGEDRTAEGGCGVGPEKGGHDGRDYGGDGGVRAESGGGYLGKTGG
ncbi:hypothetical protein DH2020_011935 [Rehmannia glutinosa]|uniref:Adenylate isopentenyltransferase n=1 Tax=Rehmannia glutinosa TaxID=99300 RepID=A0ABR0XEV6_REHGL